MSGTDDDVETLSFEASRTGRFGSAAGAADDDDDDDEIPTPTLPDLHLDDDSWSGFDAPTVERTPSPIGLIEENAPLDRDATERSLLAAIASGDESSRQVYADWLEERSEHARAAFLRVEPLVARLPADDPRREHGARQLRDLVPHIDPDWRARVARPPIEGCPSFAFRCPQRWDALARTEREEVRYCGACTKHVYYFESVGEAREAARQGHCVAIDLGAERWERDLVDLGTRCGGCSRRVFSSARFCPHCGESLDDDEPVRVGMLELLEPEPPET